MTRNADEQSVEWHGHFIGADRPGGPVPVFRRTFDVRGPVTAALLRTTYLGIGRTRLNGRAVDDEVLAPGWQSYAHRLAYSSADVTALLEPGLNTLEIEVADGWYSGRLGFLGQREVYGEGRAALAELTISGPEGTTTVATDTSWTWRPGPTLAADLYDGETYDARVQDEPPVGGWRPTERRAYDLALLEPRLGPPVRRTETVRPVAVLRTPSGKVVLDIGRNVVGWARLRVQGPAGTEVVLRFAEVLEDGELGVRPLRTARATDRYVLRGDGTEIWEPAFTYHGFRYVQVDGWPGGAPDLDAVEAVVVHSDLERTGWFRTSHPGLSQLHENVVASTRGNFVSIPTDCPQRDERLGWTGDIAVFAPTAAFLYDCTEFLGSWLRDVAHEQRPDGSLPHFVPSIPFTPEVQAVPQFGARHVAVWGDAATLVPSALYDATGDPSVLRENYPLMRRWVDGVAEAVGTSRIWDQGFQFGDWLDPVAPPDDPASGATDPALVATAYFAHSARLLARAADALGESPDAERYRTLADEVTSAFRRTFLTGSGLPTSDSQTAHALVLCLDLVDDAADREAIGRRLVELVRANGHHIGTGFVGTALILDALTRAGALDDAYALLLQEECPSWLYAVSMGATTVWERWDSMLPDGSVNPGEMTSFNHYALGAVAAWLHSTVAGLAPAEPGYRSIRVAPRPRGPVRDAGASHRTPFGLASVDWVLTQGTLTVTIQVPPGTTAVIDVEGADPVPCGPGTHTHRFAVTRADEVGMHADEVATATP